MAIPSLELLEPIKALHGTIRDAVVAACEAQSFQELASVAKEEHWDTIFQIDRVSEEVLVGALERDVACHTPLILIAEGISEEGKVLPEGTDPTEATLRVIVDPIDGTRGLMYQKRSAWILTGVAPNHGQETRLSDIELAVQTEIPLVKQHLCDSYWAVKGEGAFGERWNRLTGETTPLAVTPSQETHLEQGFITMARYFPGVQGTLGGMYDAWVEEVMGPPVPGKAQCFEDQYISTGGHFAELLSGHDRVVADLRPLIKGSPLGLCSHPYDLCTELIAREAGVVVTDHEGARLDAPLDLHTDVDWVGVANRALYEKVIPVLQQLVKA